MTIDRRAFNGLLGLSATGLVLRPGAGFAQAPAPLKGLEILAPSSPGSGYDQLSRTIQAVLTEEKLATEIQVLNVAGGGGTVGLAQFATGRKRGANLLVIGFALVGGILTTKSPLSLTALTPVARLMGEASVIVTGENSPFKSMADVVAKLKADPASVRIAGGSVGGIDHVLAGLVVKAVGVDPKKMNFIVHAGGGEVMASTLGGHVSLGISGAEEFQSQIKAGKLRALAVSSDQRIPGMDAPTLKEQGIDVAIMNWRGILTHPETPEADRTQLSAVIEAMVKSAAWTSALERRGWSDTHLPGPEFGKFLVEENKRVGDVLKEVGIIT